MKNLFIIAAFCAASASFVISIDAQEVRSSAPSCTDEVRKKDCQLPNCRCSGTDIPGGFSSNQIPQLVFLTFDDAISSFNHHFYKSFFNKARKNPNGHPITGTFYVTHEYTDYSMVHDLWRDGHEIALHSMSKTPYVDYWKNINESMWIREAVEQREQMSTFAKIPSTDIKGFRAPFFQTGGDQMYKVLKDHGFEYESSRPTLIYRKPGLWPYTNDYKSTQDCPIVPCSIGQYKGLWTVPLVSLVGNNGEVCSVADSCLPIPTTQKSTFEFLMRNFNEQYQYGGNRSPFGIFIHAQWLSSSVPGFREVENRRAGFEKFIDYILTLGDVYVVSVTRGLEWVKTPKDIQETKTFEPFKVHASAQEKVNLCKEAHRCRYVPAQISVHSSSEKYLDSCVPCPKTYPWVGNHLGK